MGEGLKKMFDEIHFSSRAEEEEDLGEDSNSDGVSNETYAIPSPRKQLPSSPSSPFNSDDLPKGLSKYYQGKSQSFTSLSKVQSLEDLPKKEKGIAYTRKMKSCKSYSAFDEDQLSVSSSSETCSKSLPNKAPPSMATCASSMERKSSSVFFIRGSRPPPIPVNKHK